MSSCLSVKEEKGCFYRSQTKICCIFEGRNNQIPMKKYIITLLFCTLFCHLGIAQGLKSVSILGILIPLSKAMFSPILILYGIWRRLLKDGRQIWFLYVIPGGISLLRRTTTVFVWIIRFPVLLFAIPVTVRRIIATVLSSPGWRHWAVLILFLFLARLMIIGQNLL